MITIFLRSSLIWCGFFVLAFINGALREIGLKQFIHEPWAHHLSALTAILLFATYLYFVFDKTLITETREAVLIGLYWLVLTVLAETFVVGRMIGKQSYEQIFSNYNILAGNLWPLVLLFVAVSPLLFLRR